VTDSSGPPAPTDAPDDASDAAPSPAARAGAVALTAVAAAGFALHVALYLVGDPDWVVAYVEGPWLKVAAVVAFVNLVAGWMHYRRTRMRLDVAARVLTYLWILSIVLMLRAAYSGAFP